MARRQTLEYPTRRMLCASGAAAAIAVALAPARAAADDVQPLARESHFPQMPTGFTGVTPCGSLAPPKDIPSSGRIAARGEPGQPLEISGRVYLPDGRTPVAGIVVFAYHTDNNGHYNNPDSPFNPRIYGWVKTDKDGRYSFQTIKPAPYPSHSQPAHIHVSLFGPGYPEYWVDDYWFEGDALITPAARKELTGRGGPGQTVHLAKGGDGVLRGRRDFVLEHVRIAGGCLLL